MRKQKKKFKNFKNTDITFWNIHGIKNIYDIDQEDKQILLKASIIGLTETWLENQSISLPNYLKGYKHINNTATRTKAKGRCSGGILLLYKDTFELKELISCNKNCIIARLCHKRSKYNVIIATVYIPPGDKHDKLLEDVFCCIDAVQSTEDIIIGGDFNARTASEQIIPVDLNPSLNQQRSSMDVNLSPRGKLLLGLLEINSFVMCNGRTESDIQGNPTFINRNGSSVVDYIITDPTMALKIEDFKVENAAASDHQPITISVHLPLLTQTMSTDPIPTNTKTFLKWNPLKSIDFKAAMHKLTVPDPNAPVDTQYEDFTNAIIHAANATGLLHRTRNKIVANQPYFDRSCAKLKRKLNDSLRTCKKLGFKAPHLNTFLARKLQFKSLLKTKKESYYQQVGSKIASNTNPAEFWKAVKSLNKSASPPCEINKESWEAFYDNVLPLRNDDNTKFYGVAHPFLDSPIDRSEVLLTLKQQKVGKSPGVDCVRNEFLKNLPLKWSDALTTMFNTSISTEIFPKNLLNIEVVMLHKKGDTTDPRNYRGISLINTVLKTLTSVLLRRLETWVEDNNLLPEAQAGFRKGRGCTDHIFTLDATREIFRKRCKRRKLHLLFVDFARAFDSINHSKLWKKLNTLGISPKLIRVLKSIYDGATMSVRTVTGHTKKYEVAEGVLQGELTSPLLFSLYISDIEDIYKLAEVENLRGINLNHKHSFHVLAYADDMVILADCPTQLQRKLDLLKEYCDEWGLTVNVQKTKILIFHHEHKAILSNIRFVYGEKPVEVVKTFTYLGVTFCTCGKFHEHVKAVKAKCAAATKTIISIIAKSRTTCWQSMMRLKDSMLLSITLYASEIWGLNEAKEVDKIQNTFIRRLLHLPANSPGYLLRMETGILPVTYHILRRSLCWLNKVREHNDTRLTNICYRELVNLGAIQSTPSPLNWFSRLKQELQIPFVEQETACYNLDYLNIGDLVAMHVVRCESVDIERCDNSSYNSFYHKIKSRHSPERYLSFHLTLQQKRSFSNMRLHVDRLPFLNIYINHTSYKFTPTSSCPLCGKDNDDLFHALAICTHYSCIRPASYGGIHTRLHTHKLFQSYDIEYVKIVCGFLCNLLRRRQFLLGD